MREERGGKGEGGKQRGRQEEGWKAVRKVGGMQSKHKRMGTSSQLRTCLQ